MTKSNFIRGTIGYDLYDELMKLKKNIIEKKIITNERYLTLPKLQSILIEKQKRGKNELPEDVIRRIVLN